MASKTTLTAKNLEALGAERLAELLIEISTGDAAIKRRLRLELAGAASPAEAAREVRKRLASIARGRSFIDWEKRKAFVADLATQRRAIIEQVAKDDPGEALDLLWQFTALAGPVFERCDDSSGTVIGEFHAACHDLAEIAAAARPDPRALADRTFTAITANGYGEYDGLITLLVPALGPDGIEHLKARVKELARTPVAVPSDKDRRMIGWASSGPIYADQVARSGRDITVQLALEAIADAQGDVDGFIAQKSDKARTVPTVAAEIARRLLDAGRAEEAWAAINAAATDRIGDIPFEWQETRLAVMEALGMAEEAQAFRWGCFQRFFDATHLRDYLKRLPDFEDIEAEERALALRARLAELPRRALVPRALARPRPCRRPGGDARGRARRRPLRIPRACRRGPRSEASAGCHADPARADRLHAHRGAIESLPPRGAAPAGVPGPRRPDRGLRRLRDPRGLPCPAQGRARSQGVLLEPAGLTALPADPPDQEVAAALAVHLPAVQPPGDDAERVLPAPGRGRPADAEAVAEMLPRHPAGALPHQPCVVALEVLVPGDRLLQERQKPTP